jgi:hypothetical protein
MRTTKRIVTTLLLIFSFSFSYAQQDSLSAEQMLGEHKKYIKNAEYVFEGTVTQQKDYNGKNQAIKTCIIQINKIFKGSPQLKLGSIKVVIWQGPAKTNGINQSMMNVDEGYWVFPVNGGSYIIFARHVGPPWCVDSTITDNNITLTTWGGVDYSIIINGDSVNW